MTTPTPDRPQHNAPMRRDKCRNVTHASGCECGGCCVRCGAVRDAVRAAAEALSTFKVADNDDCEGGR